MLAAYDALVLSQRQSASAIVEMKTYANPLISTLELHFCVRATGHLHVRCVHVFNQCWLRMGDDGI